MKSRGGSNTQQSKSGGGLVTKYLLAYNGIQVIGWAYILFYSMRHMLQVGSNFGLWPSIGWAVQIFQTLAILEVLHAASGIVSSSVSVVAIQIASRLFVVWGILWSVRRIYNSISIPLLLVPWAVTEIIRYSYYFFSQIGYVPYVLVWCRYTFFIALYPLGVMGELMSMLVSLPYIKASEMYSFTLPNVFNFSFNYMYAVLLIALSYVPLFPMLYLHMFSQRRKILSPKKKGE